jgi:hypothetical protein
MNLSGSSEYVKEVKPMDSLDHELERILKTPLAYYKSALLPVPPIFTLRMLCGRISRAAGIPQAES